jgi:predicted transcriptional regulator
MNNPLIKKKIKEVLLIISYLSEKTTLTSITQLRNGVNINYNLLKLIVFEMKEEGMLEMIKIRKFILLRLNKQSLKTIQCTTFMNDFFETPLFMKINIES